MQNLKSPGVYVAEVASGNAPIAGVGTSTAGFIGVINQQGSGTDAKTRTETVQLAAIAGKSDDIQFRLPSPPSLKTGETFEIITDANTYSFTVGTATAARAVDGFPTDGNQRLVKFKTALNADAEVKGSFQVKITTPAAQSDLFETSKLVAPEVVKLCTNFSEFKEAFGDFSNHKGHSNLVHAVFGFFRNGGTRCFVVWVDSESKIQNALDQFEAIDEIAIVAAPGLSPMTSDGKPSDAVGKIKDHCVNLGDRFAILDGPETVTSIRDPKLIEQIKPFNSDYTALYFPWIQVYDPLLKTERTVPPSGHIAGVYARVDTQRGVHKAPANEPILGTVGLAYPISKAIQDGLNPDGINCIRNLNGNFLVWGARTLGGEKASNPEFMYINVRRLFNYLRESIDEGTQWTVFEPNSPDLWAKIRRNVTAFLTLVWRSGALFGATPEQAFYVKCDEETNPPAVRDRGQVVTEIGVAVVKPAEFVVFKICQWSGNSDS